MATRLYIRLPCKIEEELTIKNLHPDIQNVKLARAKSARFCHVDFQTPEQCATVLKALKDVRVDGKRIQLEAKTPFIKRLSNDDKVVSKETAKKIDKIPRRHSSKIDLGVPRTAVIYVHNFPVNTTRRELKTVFPKSLRIQLLPAKGKRKEPSALVSFTTEEEATFFCSERISKIRGKTLKVRSSNNDPRTVPKSKPEFEK